ncbi:hypothetical protein BTHERMOSOX_1840 [Bathymodiolus thermophilus thioautotrophic gill symbiont]|uniref:Uncharacterized protein n=1 Tax=Bathymodiolus thermophilus thioautotrophic gill symbiont TaxID=2360 RepID=A0A8H9CGU9_9GAMM|nr:hypothetical protein [Bathymodiolus thermophilus thioautotrophic gill symbiont]CAB5496366.1 hypothetical protein THERMOS_494 [Bathymodiolus thermophilus thioautotrophic gill symbiont]SGZ92243.1 hypothetical protein BTHERMOSOX_1840 [Bathymodiolus thermophilus thioautotrophic gill symbiont]
MMNTKKPISLKQRLSKFKPDIHGGEVMQVYKILGRENCEKEGYLESSDILNNFEKTT